METPDPKVYPTILGGVLRGFWTPLLDEGAQSAIFWHLKTGTFIKSACFQVPKIFHDHLFKQARPYFSSIFPVVAKPGILVPAGGGAGGCPICGLTPGPL